MCAPHPARQLTAPSTMAFNNQGMGRRVSQRPDPASSAEPESPARCVGAGAHATLLALQRTAGNRAVTSLLDRRRLQRSATPEDQGRQQVEDVRSVQFLLTEKRSRLVPFVDPDPGEASAET